MKILWKRRRTIVSRLACSSAMKIIIIIIVWLFQYWMLPFLRACSRLTTLCSTIGGCQNNVEWSQIGFNGPKPGMTRSAQSAVPVPWQRCHMGPEGSTVVHRWIGTCNVTEELKAGGTGDVREWWLVSTSVDLFTRNAGPPGNA